MNAIASNEMAVVTHNGHVPIWECCSEKPDKGGEPRPPVCGYMYSSNEVTEERPLNLWEEYLSTGSPKCS